MALTQIMGHELIDSTGASSFFGREDELQKLLRTLHKDGPRASFITGIPGGGKSAILAELGRKAVKQGVAVAMLDCRMIEPTPQGFLKALSEALGLEEAGMNFDPYALALHFKKHQSVILLCLDHYETFLLADTWMRKDFMPAMPGILRLVTANRRPPIPQWLISPAWQGVTQVVHLGPLDGEASRKLLLEAGVKMEQCDLIICRTHGNPLALKLAAAASVVSGPLSQAAALQDVMQELTEIYLSEVTDAETKIALERGSVVRRITRSLLRALPDVEESQFLKLRELPFVDSWPDGLRLHDAVHEAIHATLRATDPERYFTTRRAAWNQLCNEMRITPLSGLWRATADMLYLIENPVVREAFFPSSGPNYAVEQATEEDWPALEQIIIKHDGEEGLIPLQWWWNLSNSSFHVIRNNRGKVSGFYCMGERSSIDPQIYLQDQLAANWNEHLLKNREQEGSRTLFLRRWLTDAEGEAPSAGQAACWLDVKRAYMELRPALRRVYLTVIDLPPYAPVAVQLGFEHLPEYGAVIGGKSFQTAMLDFGPQSVDGWITRLVGDEMGITDGSPLDKKRRSLVVNGERIELTPLEFNLAEHLEYKKGQTVTREEILIEVWGHVDGIGSSNVVDAVVRTLRKKLGPLSRHVETVRGFGYRWNDLN